MLKRRIGWTSGDGSLRRRLPSGAARTAEKSVTLSSRSPFNWDVPYGEWDDARPREEYLSFTMNGGACLRV